MYNPYQMQQGFGQPQNFSATYSQMPQQLQQFTNPNYNAYFQTMPQMQAANLGSIPQMQQYQQQQPGNMFQSVTQAHSAQPSMQSLQHQMGMSMQHAATSLPASGLSNVNSVAANAHGMSGLSRLNDSASGADDQHAIAAAALQAVQAAGRLQDLGGGGGHHGHHGHHHDSHGGGGGGPIRGGGGAERQSTSTKAEHAADRAAARRPKKDKPKKPSGTETKPRTSVFSRPCKISPELQNVVGGDMMTRSEVVSRMWKYVRDNNLLDPKQKQFAVCDDKLERVIGEKRFRVFGMMKYLKLHIFDPASQAAAEKKAALAAAATAAMGGVVVGASGDQMHQLHNNGSGGDVGGGAPHNGGGGGVQFAPPIDQSSPAVGGGGMHHSHSQHDLSGAGGGADLGSLGQVSVADDGNSPNDDALGNWNDQDEPQD